MDRPYLKLALFVFALGLSSAPLGLAAAADAPVVTDARIGVHENVTRFVFNVSDAVEVRAFTLAEPYRAVLDLPAVKWDLPLARPIPPGSLITGFRYGPLSGGRVRVVIDLAGPAKLESIVLVPPQGERRYRLVADFVPTDPQTFARGAGFPADERGDSARSQASANAKTGRRKPIVFLDPGHGGPDPGATGPSGTKEKDIVLAVALKLRDVLRRTGRYQVFLTRETDIRLALRERVAMARAAKADLMISIHADAAGANVVANMLRGATVYTLSENASDKEAEELANSENQADVIAGVDLTKEPNFVSSILIDLAQRETMNKSIRFAQKLVPELQHTGKLVPKFHKFAGFRVLKAPDVPSVLLEIGYLSNLEDETQMRNSAWRQQLAQAIVRAIDRYFAADKDQSEEQRPGR